jgi:aminopeptidase N
LALPKLANDRKAREALEELLEDLDPHLRVDVARALAELGDTKARPALRTRLEIDLDPRVRRRLKETLRDLGGDSRRAVDQVREELDKMTNEHADLKARLAKVEARLGVRSGSQGEAALAPGHAKAGKAARTKKAKTAKTTKTAKVAARAKTKSRGKR